MKIPTQCPNCGSTTTRSRSVVYESGTSNYSGRSSSRGLSFGLSRRPNPRAWFGGGTHSGTRQTVLAQTAGPMPAAPNIGILLLGFFLHGINFYPFAIFIIIAWFIYSYYYNNTVYIKQWICCKCGFFFEPDKLSIKYANERSNEIFQLIFKIYYPNSENERNDSITKAEILIREIEISDTVNSVKNFHKLKNDITLIRDLKPILIQLDKADKSLFSKDKKNESKYLLQSLYSLIKINITNEEFNSFKFKSEITKNIWTVKYLKKRLLDAGYIP